MKNGGLSPPNQITNERKVRMNCPTCERIKYSNGQPVALAHPEEVGLLCPTHHKQLQEWHDGQVNKGFITPWVGLTPKSKEE